MKLCFLGKRPSSPIIFLPFYLPTSPSYKSDHAGALGVRSGTKWSLRSPPTQAFLWFAKNSTIWMKISKVNKQCYPFWDGVNQDSQPFKEIVRFTSCTCLLIQWCISNLHHLQDWVKWVSGEWKLEWDFEWVVNLCKAVMNSISQIPDCLR